MLRQLRLAVSFAIALVLAFPFASTTTLAASTTLWVNHDSGPWVPPGTSCDNPGFQTIQAAVTAAPPGARINVCPGTYVEQVVVPVGKNGLYLRSVKHWQAIIKAPPVMLDFKAIVQVSALDVTLLAFTITGPGGGPCDSIRYGVRVADGGHANILGNHITQIHDTPFSGCQNGVAVLVGRVAEGAVGSARVIGNVIDTYQKNGPTVSNVGSYAEIAHNRILGIGPTAVIAQNGVQISGGATANVRHNFIAGHIYTPQAVSSTGVLLFDPGVTIISHNTITSNDVGEYTFLSNSASTVSHNRIRASTFDGVVIESTSNEEVAQNKIEDNDGPGVGFYDASDNKVSDNHIVDNDDSGVLFWQSLPSTGNLVTNNRIRDNGTDSGDTTDGIRVELGSVGNTFDANKLRDNLTHDCHDFNPPGANTWTNNHGETSVPAGICSRHDGAAFTESTAFGWNANYAWYAEFGDAAEFDWAAAYATVDIDALGQLVAQLGLRSAHGRPVPAN